MKSPVIFFVFCSFLFLNQNGFSQKVIFSEESLKGKWIYKKNDGKSFKFIRIGSFEKRKPGIEFKEKGNLIIRQNAGSCGTPPITYDNFKGQWEKTSDSTVVINYNFWGGKIEREMIIIDVSRQQILYKNSNYKIHWKK